MKARRKNSASWWILTMIEKSIDGYVRLEDFTYHAYRYQYGIPNLKKASLAMAIKRLKEQGLIDQATVKDDLVFKLTQSGDELINIDNKPWDGKWRIVIWDIPEEKRVIRNLFRRNLKKWGFKHLQKSVWVSKADVFDKLSNYISELGIEKWVTIIEANRISQIPF